MNATARALAGWALVAVSSAIGAVACGADGAPPLPAELESFRDEPVQELACVRCHGPGGVAGDTALPPGLTDLPSGHVPLPTPSP